MTNILKLTHHEGTTYVTEYRWRRYRFLLSDGSTLDAWAVTDDSWLRDQVLKIANKIDKLPKDHKYDIIISGSTVLPEPESEEPAQTPKKRAARKKVEAEVTTDEPSDPSQPDPEPSQP